VKVGRGGSGNNPGGSISSAGNGGSTKARRGRSGIGEGVAIACGATAALVVRVGAGFAGTTTIGRSVRSVRSACSVRSEQAAISTPARAAA